jgi:predicted 2-oxoglutarate/Fe(II)-dependent dioxygenase YbiX
MEPEIHYLKVENYFTDGELDLIWKELDHLNRPGIFEDPAATGASMSNETGEIRKRNAGVFIKDVYQKPKYSAIQQSLQKLFAGYTHQYALKHYTNQGVMQTNSSNHLISYYENSDHYLPHRDEAVATALHWLWKEPKKFEGGEFTFTETDETIPLTNNTMIIFPSYAEHAVSPVIMDPEDCGKGLGRYCLSTFIFTSLNS